MNGTTIKLIAARSGISEGVIYRHFESKDQLFFEAVVEPLHQAVDDLVAATELFDQDEPLTPERQLAGMTGLYQQLVATLVDLLPLLGLVLFGDPEVAKRFYQENFSAAMDRLAEAWRVVEDRYGFPFESPDISARAVMGMALMMALESHHGKKFDRNARSPDQRGHRQGLLPGHGPIIALTTRVSGPSTGLTSPTMEAGSAGVQPREALPRACQPAGRRMTLRRVACLSRSPCRPGRYWTHRLRLRTAPG